MKPEVKIGGMLMKNPVMTASGTFGYGAEYSEFVDLNRLGAVVVKGISLTPREGNPPPRIHETPCGMLNSIGLQNVGLQNFLNEKLPFLRKYDTRVVVNILGSSPGEYEACASELDGMVDAIELNVSCPNVKEGDMLFSSDRNALMRLVSDVRKRLSKTTMIVKLTPSSPDIALDAKICEEEGADAVSMINTIPAMAIDIETGRPRLANVIGGLSGPAVKPIGVRMVWETYGKISIPIIGMGGIMTGEDAVEYLLAGASAVAVGTANFVDPRSTLNVLEGILDYMKRKGIDSINRLTGGMVWDHKDL